MNAQALVSSVTKFIGKNSTKILTGVAVAGIFATVGTTVKATKESVETLSEYKENDIDLETKDVIRLCWRNYIPVLMAVSGTVCAVLELNHVHSKTRNALMSAFLITADDLEKYKKKAVSLIGEKKGKEILDSLAQDKVTEAGDPEDVLPATPMDISGFNGEASTLCFDCASGRYFMSNIEWLQRVENKLNKLLLEETWVSLNDAYEHIGIDAIGIGDDLGWDAQKAGLIDFAFSSVLTPDGRPCLALNFTVKPKYAYYY